MSPESGITSETGGTDPPIMYFGEFRLDVRLRSLHRGSEKIKLTPKPFAALGFLVLNRERVVSKAELLERIWGGLREVSTVEHAIGQLRRALGDDAETGRYIETVPGQGYRFVAAVHASGDLAVAASIAIDGHAEAGARQSRRVLIPAAVLAGVSVIGATIAYVRAPAHVAGVIWNGNTVVAMGDSGRALWKYAFPAALWQPPDDASAWRNQIVDLDGDGVPEVLVATSFGVPAWGGRQEILCFSSHGNVRWSYQPKEEIEFKTPDLNGPWKFTHMLVVPGKRSASIWVAVVHEIWWPSFIVRLSSAGVPKRVFTSSGDIMALRQFESRAGSFLLAAGINNEYRQASLAILSEDGSPVTSPQTPGSAYQCIRGCLPGTPYRYVLLPRSELNAASDQPYNVAVQIFARPGGITVETRELTSMPGPPGAFYDFSQDLQPERVAYGGNYREVHQRFEREGRIHHSFKECPERNSPALVRICDDQGNWITVKVPRAAMPD